MSEYSMERRKALLEQMRGQEGNTKAPLAPVHERYQAYEKSGSSDENLGNFQMWKVKFFIGLFLFAGFLFLDVTGTKLYKVTASSVETAITEAVDTKQVSNFVQDKVGGILDF